MLSRVLSFPRFTQFHNVFLLRIKCLFIKLIKTNREPSNAATFASALTYTTTALPVGRLAREVTPVSSMDLSLTYTSPSTQTQKVLLQGSGVPAHLPPVRAGHSPPGLYNDCKGSETNGPLKRTQNSPIPGRLTDQVPVSGGSPSEHTGSGRPNSVLGVDNKSGKIRTETYSGVFVRGLRIPPRFSPCKTHSREMAQTFSFSFISRSTGDILSRWTTSFLGQKPLQPT